MVTGAAWTPVTMLQLMDRRLGSYDHSRCCAVMKVTKEYIRLAALAQWLRRKVRGCSDRCRRRFGRQSNLPISQVLVRAAIDIELRVVIRVSLQTSWKGDVWHRSSRRKLEQLEHIFEDFAIVRLYWAHIAAPCSGWKVTAG